MAIFRMAVNLVMDICRSVLEQEGHCMAIVIAAHLHMQLLLELGVLRLHNWAHMQHGLSHTVLHLRHLRTSSWLARRTAWADL